ncbi:MAG: nucleotide exchange factor GrpE [Clostridia bacterium]|nr:nucleotide exchange factor GrpE [Clostridia bacterium]
MKEEKKKKKFEEACECGEECHCGDDCQCGDECHCGDCGCEEHECTCGDDCNCEEGGEDCGCHGKHNHNYEHNCGCGHNHEAEQYLLMAQRMQADFENYRKRVAEQLDFQRQEGVKSVIEVFLPCLDAFKEAKRTVSDENMLTGINMIENKILEALKTLNVEKIEAIGKTFDPHLHNVIALMHEEDKENDIIVDEYQAGWTLNGKVIRYSKVIVNKKGE